MQIVYAHDQWAKKLNIRFRRLKVFDRVRTECPENLKKMKAMEGDLGLTGLGLSQENMQILFDEVSVVYNGAASLRLEAGLKDAIRHNTTGTKYVLELATKIKNLAVSTLFSIIISSNLSTQILLQPKTVKRLSSMISKSVRLGSVNCAQYFV